MIARIVFVTVSLIFTLHLSGAAKAEMSWDATTYKEVSLDSCEDASRKGVLMWVDRRAQGETRWFRFGRALFSQRLTRVDERLTASCFRRFSQ